MADKKDPKPVTKKTATPTKPVIAESPKKRTMSAGAGATPRKSKAATSKPSRPAIAKVAKNVKKLLQAAANDMAAVAHTVVEVLESERALRAHADEIQLHSTEQSAHVVGIPGREETALFVERSEDNPCFITEQDIYLFNEGSHQRLYERLGSQVVKVDGVQGVHFGIWAPNAAEVSVTGEFNGWTPGVNRLRAVAGSGLWEGFVPGLQRGTVYKYNILSLHNGYRVDKADPFAFMHEVPARTASVVWDLEYEWKDSEWMKGRGERNSLQSPMSIYEMHIGSWMHRDGHSLSYRDLAEPLAAYLREMNFTHVQFMPVMEHPYYASWGYQITGYFAPTSRFGTPQDLMYLIDYLHQQEIGVLLDWVPSHFPSDEHGLGYFDGTHLFEHADPRQGFQPDWGSLVFNYGRNEVRSFLLSNAIYWVDKYHADGLRVDAVASMLYLDYSRKEGEWIPNEWGGRENLEAISFLRRVNEDLHQIAPDTQIIAEESTAWPMVSRPTHLGGLGFGMKWDMGWMHDTLKYMSTEPVHRRFHHGKLTFRMLYAFTENFVLPLSHDEVVHGKGSLLNKMPGDDWQKFANLRLLYAYMYAQPGKKMLFMGAEIGQWREWSHDRALDWDLLEFPIHGALRRWVSDLNAMYRDNPAMHRRDSDPHGFEWIDCDDSEQSVISLIRHGFEGDQDIVAAFNFTPVPRTNYLIGADAGGFWTEILNSDAEIYGGSGQGNMGRVEAAPISQHGRRFALNLTIPPLGAVFLRREKP